MREQLLAVKWPASGITKFGLALSMHIQCVASNRYKFSSATQQPDRTLFPPFFSFFHIGGRNFLV